MGTRPSFDAATLYLDTTKLIFWWRRSLYLRSNPRMALKRALLEPGQWSGVRSLRPTKAYRAKISPFDTLSTAICGSSCRGEEQTSEEGDAPPLSSRELEPAACGSCLRSQVDGISPTKGYSRSSQYRLREMRISFR